MLNLSAFSRYLVKCMEAAWINGQFWENDYVIQKKGDAWEICPRRLNEMAAGMFVATRQLRSVHFRCYLLLFIISDHIVHHIAMS